MKVVNKNIAVVCSFSKAGEIKIHRFRLTDEYGEEKVFKIQNQLVEEMKIAGKNIKVFTCQILLNNTLRKCEIHYSYADMKFTLFKI